MWSLVSIEQQSPRRTCDIKSFDADTTISANFVLTVKNSIEFTEFSKFK